MWVMTQNRKALFDIHNACISEVVANCIKSDNDFLGMYEDEKRCKEVLFDLADHVNKDTVFIMPEE